MTKKIFCRLYLQNIYVHKILMSEKGFWFVEPFITNWLIRSTIIFNHLDQSSLKTILIKIS